MILFYPEPDDVIVVPIAMFDALDSSDRFSQADITTYSYIFAPSQIDAFLNAPDTFSCVYDFIWEHNGIPLGEGLKSRFSCTVTNPPADLISQFTPSFFTSSDAMEDIANIQSKFANPQTSLAYGVLVVRNQENQPITRSFVIYAAHIQPDPYGATTSMTFYGSAYEDAVIKSSVSVIIKKSLPLQVQLSEFLVANGYVPNFPASFATTMPAADILIHPMQLNKALDQICVQNKLVYKISGLTISFYTQSSAPAVSGETASFSFLGYAGSVAWAMGVENYVNIKFKTPYFDASLYQTITLYNDMNTSLFSGLPKSSGDPDLIDYYTFYIIRYRLIRNAGEIVTEVTASSNWILGQMRIDGLLEPDIYANAAG